MTQVQTTPLPEEMREKVLEYLGIQYAPKEKQDEVLAKIGEVAFQKMIMAVLSRFDEETQKQYNVLLDSDPQPEQIEAFFKEHVPDYAQVSQGAVDTLMKDLIAAGDNAVKSFQAKES